MDTSRCNSQRFGANQYTLTHTHTHHKLFCRQLQSVSGCGSLQWQIDSLSSLLLRFQTCCLPFFFFFLSDWLPCVLSLSSHSFLCLSHCSFLFLSYCNFYLSLPPPSVSTHFLLFITSRSLGSLCYFSCLTL